MEEFTPTLLLIQIAILLLPGAMWARIDASYGKKRNPGQFDFLIRSILFGLAAYALTYLILIGFGQPFEMIKLSQAADKNVLTDGIVWQTLAGLAIGFMASIIWLYFVNKKILTKGLHRLGATNTYGDEDVWDFALNSDDIEVTYVNIRDFENQIVYSGWIEVFSETGKLREIVLTEVDVHDFEGNLLFSTPRIYIARKPEGMHMEFPIYETQSREEFKDDPTTLTPEEQRRPWLREAPH